MAEFTGGALLWKEDPPTLLDVVLDVDISVLLNDFLLEDAENLDLLLVEVVNGLADGPGGGIRARADICLCINTGL